MSARTAVGKLGRGAAIASLMALAAASADAGTMSITDLGNFGVVVFFLTSGFIIPVSLERSGSAGRFWVGRVFRLYPLYWLSLALAVAFHLGGFAPAHELEAAFRKNVPVNTLVNITMLQQLVGVPHAIAPYWTLSVELMFYAGCTAFLLAGIFARLNLPVVLLQGQVSPSGFGRLYTESLRLQASERFGLVGISRGGRIAH